MLFFFYFFFIYSCYLIIKEKESEYIKDTYYLNTQGCDSSINIELINY